MRKKGMPALRKYAKTLDGLKKDESLRVPEEELRDALSSASPEFVQAVQKAAANIRRLCGVADAKVLDADTRCWQPPAASRTN